MIRKYSILLKYQLLFTGFFVLQIMLVVLFHYIFPKTPINELMMLAIDISLLICVLAGFKYLKSNNFQTTTYTFNILIFCTLLMLSFLWFLISPLFKIHPQKWSIDVRFKTHSWSEILTNPTFFKVYGLLRLLLIVPILKNCFTEKFFYQTCLRNTEFTFQFLFLVFFSASAI